MGYFVAVGALGGGLIGFLAGRLTERRRRVVVHRIEHLPRSSCRPIDEYTLRAKAR